MTTNRIQVNEINLSGFAVLRITETAAFVVDSYKGKSEPLFVQSEKDYIKLFGTPNAAKSGGFDVISFVKASPAWVVSAIGANAKYAGLDVGTNAVIAFGSRTGRTSPSSVNYANVSRNDLVTVGTGNGINGTFAYTLPNTPITNGSLQFKIGTTTLNITDGSGVLTGSDVTSGTINLNSGALNVVLNGAPGTVAEFLGTVDLDLPFDFATICTSGYQQISFGTPILGTSVPGLGGAGTVYSLNRNIDGAGAADVTFTVAAVDNWNTIAAAIDTALVGATASVTGGKIKIISSTVGNTSSIAIADGTTGAGGGFLAALTALSITNSIDTAIVGKNAGFKVSIDNGAYVNIDLGKVSQTAAQMVTAINTQFGSTIASVSGTTFLKIVGAIGDATYGAVDLNIADTLVNAIPYIFKATATSYPVIETTAATNPTGAIPRYNQQLKVDYIYTIDLSTWASHSFFTASPMSDSKYQYGMKIAYVSGSKYTYTLYESDGVTPIDGNSGVTYSLIQETDNFGKSIYIMDVFKDHAYLIPVINPAYASTANPTVATIMMTGGNRGDAPLSSHYLAAWTNFQAKDVYPVDIFIDIYGNSASYIDDLIDNYQKNRSGITCVPFATGDGGVAAAVAYRQGMGIDNDMLALYYNWQLIQDPYNNSFAWISGMGKVGVKYAQMSDVFDGLSPAGTDENGHGGQLSGFTVKQMQIKSFSDPDLNALTAAQINPIVFDPTYGVTIAGDNTLTATLSDTSYIHTRRIYNRIIRAIRDQVLRDQVFKLNDDTHRRKARTLIGDLMSPIMSKRLLREVVIVCDTTNNTDAVLDRSEFVIDIYVKAARNSQLVILNFTRLRQGQVIAELLAA